MKRILPLLCVLLLLTGCGMVEHEYRSVKPHEIAEQSPLPEAVEVGNYDQLRDAIVRFVKAGRPEGTIRTVNYDGDVEKDLLSAIYDAIRLEPIGAYAVDYLNHDCVKLLNYYEIHLSITYRRTAAQIASVQPADTPEQLQGQIFRSLKHGTITLQYKFRRIWSTTLTPL